MKLATMALAGALALSSAIALAQAGGTGGSTGASSTGSTGSSVGGVPPAGNPPGTTGQVRPGAMGNPNMPGNLSGNSLINTSPSGSTLDQTGTGTHR
jgi:hypothetical protein